MPLLANLVAYSAQVTVIVAVGAALAALVRVDAAGVRYVYWRALLALCLVLPWLQVRRYVIVPMADSLAAAAASTSSLTMASPAVNASLAATNWAALITWVLLAGVVVRACRVGFGLWRLRQLRRAGTRAARCAIHDEAQELVRARAEIRYVESGQPVTFGFIRPVVLLPERLRAQPAAIQQVVLCHELFHVRRRDWAWVVAEEIVKIAVWFHPAVIWLVDRVRQTREEVVDELTVLATSQRRAYIEALLVFADAPGRAPAAAFGRRRHLFRRMVLISKETVMSSRRILASVAAMTAVVAIGAWSAVSLFPLTETVFAQGRAGAVSVPQGQAGPAGPLERQAKPITPENPIPRRTFFVLPRNPSTPAGGVTIASARIVIDRQGRVVEARGTGAGVRGGGSAESNGPPIESFVRALVDAVRQWQYDPPADGPIAFDVAFAFVPGTEPRLITHGSPVPGALAGLPVAPPSPPPPPPPPGWGRGAIRVGNDVKPPQKTRHVAPVYPQAAQAAHVQGVVILEAIIGEDGKVQDARVLRSIPLLDQAALDAVRGWEFMPTLLNGAPVSVMMTVTIQFTLS